MSASAVLGSDWLMWPAAADSPSAVAGSAARVLSVFVVETLEQWLVRFRVSRKRLVTIAVLMLMPDHHCRVRRVWFRYAKTPASEVRRSIATGVARAFLRVFFDF